MLEAGDVVPADMRLLEAASLKIEEAALTGESVPVEKDVTETVDAEAGIGDRVNMGYQNSNVTYGRGTGVVTNTGMYTEVGKIADMLANADESQTPLKQSLEQLSKTLTYLIVAIALVTFLCHLAQRPLLNVIRLFVNCQLLKPLVQQKLSHQIRLVP